MARQSILISFICFAALVGAPVLAQDIPAAAPSAVRIGIVLPEAQLGQGNSGQDVAEPVRQLLMSYMAGPRLELVPLQSRIAAQIDAEAKALDCTHVLYTRVSQKKAGKGMGGISGMLGVLGPAAGMVPGLGAMGGERAALVAGATQAISQAAMQSAQEDAMASLSQAQAGSVKARDEITLTFRFVTVSGARPTLEETLQAKATQNGEDLLKPLAEQVATRTVTAALTP